MKNIGLTVVLLLAAIGALLVLLLLAISGSPSGPTADDVKAPDGRENTLENDDADSTAETAKPGNVSTSVDPARDRPTERTTGRNSADATEGTGAAPDTRSVDSETVNGGTSRDSGGTASNVDPGRTISGAGGGAPSAVPSIPPRRTVPAVAISTGKPVLPPVKAGKIVLVIDDVGYSREQLRPFLKFPGPVTFAVLPGLPYTEACAEAIRAAGKQAILHLPMEAVGGMNPGPGALFRAMNDLEILSTIRNDLDQVGDVRGVNNHQGSAVTGDDRIMRLLLGELERRGLFFLDSMTTSVSLGERLAGEIGLPFLERDVFLDNEKSGGAIRAAIAGGLETVQNQGSAVFIGHVTSAELATVLNAMYPELIEHGFEFSYPEDIINRPSR